MMRRSQASQSLSSMNAKRTGLEFGGHMVTVEGHSLMKQCIILLLKILVLFVLQNTVTDISSGSCRRKGVLSVAAYYSSKYLECYYRGKIVEKGTFEHST